MKNLLISFAVLALTTSAIVVDSDPLRAKVDNPPEKAAPPAPYQPWESGSGNYTRTVPERFMGAGDDTLMRSIIEKYAVETKDKDGKPTGQFFLDKAGASTLATEVVGTHLKKSGADLTKYLDEKFPEAWDRFDVNKEGKFEASRGPSFCRYLVPDVTAGFGLQLAPKK